MKKFKITLSETMRTQTVNAEKLLRHAREVAETIIVPAGIEFARFDYNGKAYALEADIGIRVSELPARTPDRVFRYGDHAKALARKKEKEREEKAKRR